MPGIPVYQRKISIPGEAAAVPTDIGSAGIVGKSVAELGGSVVQATGEVAKILAVRNEILRKQREDAELIRYGTDINNRVLTFKTDWLQRKGRDAFDSQKAANAFIGELVKEYEPQFKDNAGMWNKVSDHIYAQGASLANVLASHELDQLKAYSADVRALDLESSIKTAQAGDPATGITNWSKTIDTQVANRSLSLEEGKILKLEGISKIQVGYISALAEKNPSMAQAAFEAAKTTLTSDDQRKLEPFVKQAIADNVEMTAYAEIAAEHGTDYVGAMAATLLPETAKKYGLTIDQQQNIANSFSALASNQKSEEQERQDRNLGVFQQQAITDPAGALRALKRAKPGDLDPKDALALKQSIESHIRQSSLMSAQEKALRMDMEDKIKSGLKMAIMEGKFKNEKELVNAIMREGLTNSSSVIDDMLGNFRAYKKDAGAINFFALAGNDWKATASGYKYVERRKELAQKLPQILQTLQRRMQEKGLSISDPEVFEEYEKIKKNALPKGIFQNWFGGGESKVEDTFISPTAPATKSAAPRRPVLDEATARKRLTDKGITGKRQDEQIKIYKDKGVVR